VVSDLASILGALVKDLSSLTLVALALVIATAWVLWRTSFGLRLRSVGESPSAAESLGVNVYRYKIVAVTVSGALAGLGGVFLAMVAQSGFQQGQTGGRGYIGLAAMIFGNWRPAGLAAGAALFGFADALQQRSTEAVHALLLLVAVILVGLAIRSVLRRRVAGAVAAAVAGALVLVAYLGSDTIDGSLVSFTPHLVTLLVLSVSAQRLRPPAADGVPYRKGQTG
jgi:simple sugar transport system permease protein